MAVVRLTMSKSPSRVGGAFIQTFKDTDTDTHHCLNPVEHLSLSLLQSIISVQSVITRPGTSIIMTVTAIANAGGSAIGTMELPMLVITPCRNIADQGPSRLVRNTLQSVHRALEGNGLAQPVCTRPRLMSRNWVPRLRKVVHPYRHPHLHAVFVRSMNMYRRPSLRRR